MKAALILFRRNAAQLELIMKIGLLPDALEPGFHCVRTRALDPGFMAFQLAGAPEP